MSPATQVSRRAAYSPFSSRAPTGLLTLPSEIIQSIIALLVCQTPLGPPAALIPVMLTCRVLKEHATRPELLATICRFKFDVGAVQRRIITPWNQNLKEQLIYQCRLLRALRRGLPARDQDGNDVPRAPAAGQGEGSSSMTSQHVEVDVDPEEILDWPPAHVLLASLMMLLDNDGKNIAQLEWAGIHTYVRQFILERLWDGSYLNDYWPLENVKNSCALWVMWLITDQEMLEQETPADRERIATKILPYVVLPQRYPSSEAPPNHFHLPLSRSPTAPLNQQHPLRFPIPSRHAEMFVEPPMRANTPEAYNHMLRPQPQMYPHYLESRGANVPYFGTDTHVVPPLSSMAAKLMYVARREQQGFQAPPHLPATRAAAPPGFAGPTREDYEVLCRSRGAPVPRRQRWDWDEGYCRVVGMQAEGQGPGDGSSKKHDVSIGDDKKKMKKDEGGAAGGGGSGDGGPENEDDDDKENRRPRVDEGDVDASKKWDTVWWRMVLCKGIFSPKPRFEAGQVFEPGCMRGYWKGKIYIPSGFQFNRLLHETWIFPGPDTTNHFSEATLGLLMQPVFIFIQEHHRVCCGASYYRDADPKRGRSRPANERGKGASRTQGHSDDGDGAPCGAVPVPPLARRDWREYPYSEQFLEQLGITDGDAQSDDESDDGSGAAQGGGSVSAGPSTASTSTTGTAVATSSSATAATATATSTEPPVITPAHVVSQDTEGSTDPSHPWNQEVEDYNWSPPQRLDHVDTSMTNAWFPGPLGSLQWMSREGGLVDIGSGAPVRRRDDLLVSANQRPDMFAKRGCVHGHGEKGKQREGSEDKGSQETWVYETFDPERIGAHEYRTSFATTATATATEGSASRAGCRQCAEREAKMQEIRQQEAAQRDHRESKEHRRHQEREARRKARTEAKKKEHAAALSMLDDMMRSFGSPPTEADAQMEDIDGEILGFGESGPADSETEDEDDSDGLVSVFGDDFDEYDSDEDVRDPTPQQAEHAKYFKDLRRGYSPSRIMRPSTTNASMPSSKGKGKDKPTTNSNSKATTSTSASASASACPAATSDIIVTGETPSSALIWGRRYTVFGRVRPWDGLVGILRVGQNVAATDFLFIFGYVVGGGTLVGEWRIASSDVMRPTLGGAIVLTRYDEE